jgi:SOS-response transcriptional repressor LexA
VSVPADFILDDAIVAKRKHTPKPGWSRAIAGLMASSRYLKTQTALARKSGVAQSTIGRILRGEVNPQSENLERLATSFGMSYSTLAAIAEGEEPGSGSAENLPPGRTPRLVPLLSLAQAAKSAEAVFPNYARDATDWIECPKKRPGPRTLALKISGESMEPDYQNGDIIYVDPDIAAVHGKDVVVRLADRNEATLRRLVVESDLHYLKSLNPNWPDKFMHIPADARIVGVVVGKYADK